MIPTSVVVCCTEMKWQTSRRLEFLRASWRCRPGCPAPGPGVSQVSTGHYQTTVTIDCVQTGRAQDQLLQDTHSFQDTQGSLMKNIFCSAQTQENIFQLICVEQPVSCGWYHMGHPDTNEYWLSSDTVLYQCICVYLSPGLSPGLYHSLW